MTSVSTDSPQSTLGRSNNYPSEKENDSGGSSLNLSKKASKRLLKQINNMPQSSPPASNYPSVTLVLTSSDAGANASNKAAVIKTIDLFENNPVKIGRQTNSKTVPSLSNGFFDSKVLSRNHAEIWVEGGKIYIKDTKSSNGTFVNGKRLSEENHESAPIELKNGDTVDFGIDIVGDDGSTLLYKRVTVKASVIGSNEKPNMETASPAAALNLSQSQANALYKIDDRAIARDFKGEARSYIPVSESKLNASNRSELTNITGSLQTQVSKAKQTSQDLDHLKSAFNQINETVSSLASATSAPNQIVPSPNDLMKQLELLKSQIQGVQTKVASLENSGGSATSNELKKEFEKYQSNMKALEKQMAELTSEVMGVKESSSQTAELTLSVSQSTANLPQLTNEVEKLNGTISELQKEKEFLESEVEVVKKLARVVNEELDEMKLENKKLKGIVEDLEGWKKSVAKDMEVVEKERKEVKQSLNELKKHTRRPRRSFLSTLFFTLSTTFLVSSLSFYVVKYTPLPSYVESKTGLKMQGVVDRMDQVVGAVVGGLAGGIGSVVGQWESSQAGTVGGNGAWVREKQNVNSDESVDGDSNAGKASKKVKVKGNKNDQGSTSKEAVVEQVKVEL